MSSYYGPFGAAELLKWSPDTAPVFESPIEARLAETIESACPFGQRPSFYLFRDIDHLGGFLRDSGRDLLRTGFIACPQLVCPPYRIDLLLVIATPMTPRREGGSAVLPAGYTAVAVEADGADYHDELRLVGDRRRDDVLAGRYGLPTPRVSGAEIIGRPRLVGETLALYIETVHRLDRLHDALANISDEFEEAALLRRQVQQLENRLDLVARLLTHVTTRAALDRTSLIFALRETLTLGDSDTYEHLFEIPRGAVFEDILQIIRQAEAIYIK